MSTTEGQTLLCRYWSTYPLCTGLLPRLEKGGQQQHDPGPPSHAPAMPGASSGAKTPPLPTGFQPSPWLKAGVKD